MGTAATDDAATFTGTKSLYELTGSERDRWIIVGVDIVVTAAIPEIVVSAAACSGGRNRVHDQVQWRVEFAGA